MFTSFSSSYLSKFLAASLILTLLLSVLPVSSALAADTGWNSPTGCTTNAATQWANPGNAVSSNNLYTTSNAGNEVLICSFNLPAIPAGNMITGIEVSFEGSSSGFREANVDLSWNATNYTTGDPTTTFGGTETTFTLGDTTDTWNRTWAVGDFTAANFRVRLTSTNPFFGGNTISLDHVQVRVTYFPTAEIDVQGNSVSITDGDTTPDLADHTNFGDVPRNFFVDRTFTINNLDSTNDLLIGAITFTGGDAGDFSVVSPPAAIVAANGSTTFTVRLTAGGGFGDTRNTTVNIVVTNDADENPFNFNVQGNRTTAGIDVQGNGVSINDGDTTPSLNDHTQFGNTTLGSPLTRTYTIVNTSGTQTLYLGTVNIGGANAGDFTVTSQPDATVVPDGTTIFTVEFDPTATGVRNASISFINNDDNESPYNFNIQGTVSPEMDVQGNGISIVDGDNTPNTTDYTDFGSVAVGSSVAHTFTIYNTGITDLTLSTPALLGAGATANYTVTTPPAPTVPPGGSTTFVITFSPTAAFGPTKNATVSIDNNDPDEDPYTFAITGTRPVPEINIQGNGISIADGDGSPSFADGTQWGFVGTSVPVDHTFTILNTGDVDLTLSNARITGSTISFSVLTPPAATVPPGGTTTVVIRFSPSALGGATKDAAFLVDTNDPDEGTYNFDLQGTRLDAGAEVDVQANGLSITDGDTTPSATDGTDFGNVSIGSSSTQTFTIFNYGANDLTISNFILTGDFSLVSTPASPVVSGGSTTFDVQFTPSGLGVQNGTISFDNNDVGTETPYNFSLTGTGIDSSAPTVTITTPSTGTSFVATGPSQIIVEFSEDVKNDGSAGAANNIANYLLVEAGTNSIFDTISCGNGMAADDVQVTVDTASYDNNGGSGPYVATLTINGGISLPAGGYRLFICGTTSVEDLASNELNSGLNDTIVDFTVTTPGNGGSNPNSVGGLLIPVTGFPQGQVTKLPTQPAEQAYASYSDLWLEIPKLNLKTSIVGVPQTSDGWNVNWLNRDAGWLNGSAFPTWKGNSVITAHVWDALNQPGPFAGLKNLKYGDQVKVHAFGQVYTYEIRESKTVLPTSTSTVFKHEEKSWITLITCEDYKEGSQTYSYRRMVRAVLVSVVSE